MATFQNNRWPQSQDFNEAVQTPSFSFSDHDLQQSEPVPDEKRGGLPTVVSGSFADVYKLASRLGKKSWAVKCFTGPVREQRKRYRAISESLASARLPYTVDFEYQKRGIRIQGEWYPIVKMEWCDGTALNRFVGDSADDPRTLQLLFDRWVEMAASLRDANIAHGDLQHGNVLVLPNNNSPKLKLVDYDGMCVPSLLGTVPLEYGHPNYQHPLRNRESKSRIEVDHFSHLVVGCALRAVSLEGYSLWHRYDNGDNLLFREPDFIAPHESHLIAKLWQSRDSLTKRLVAAIVLACDEPLGNEPFLPEFLRERSDAALLPNEKQVVEAILRRKTPSKPELVTCSECGSQIPKGKLQAHIRDCRSNRTTKPSSVESSVTRQAYPRTKRSLQRTHSQWQLSRTATISIVLIVAAVAIAVLLPKIRSLPHSAALDWPVREEATDQRQRPVESIAQTETIPPVEIDMVLIPAGEFTMGSPATEVFIPQSASQRRIMQNWDSFNAPVARREDEGPQHRVRISRPFYIGTHEVTQIEYETVMGVNLSFHPEERQLQSDNIDSAMLPVEHVSWYDAVHFCNRLSTAHGISQYYALTDTATDNDGAIGWANASIIGGTGYRLPTEAEWEYACRAGTKSAFSFGTILDPYDKWILSKANFNYAGASIWKTTPVGSYAPNSFGLFDMHGNVSEWCEDWYGKRTYAENAAVVVSIDPQGAENGEYRVIRGGSWHDLSHLGRSATRDAGRAKFHSYLTGFRVARTK